MGILELHFHESEFQFAPSMKTKGDSAMSDAESAAERGVDKITSGTQATLSDSSDDSSGGSSAMKGLRVLVGLAFLIGAGMAAKKLISRRRSSDDDDEHQHSGRVEESIEIAD